MLTINGRKAYQLAVVLAPITDGNWEREGPVGLDHAKVDEKITRLGGHKGSFAFPVDIANLFAVRVERPLWVHMVPQSLEFFTPRERGASLPETLAGIVTKDTKVVDIEEVRSAVRTIVSQCKTNAADIGISSENLTDLQVVQLLSAARGYLPQKITLNFFCRDGLRLYGDLELPDGPGQNELRLSLCHNIKERSLIHSTMPGRFSEIAFEVNEKLLGIFFEVSD